MLYSDLYNSGKDEYFEGSIPIHGNMKKTKFVSIDKLKAACFNIVEESLETTIENCSYQAPIQNVLYVDLDFKLLDSSSVEYFERRNEILSEVVDMIIKQVMKKFSIEYNLGMFPDDNSLKQGFHLFIWTTRTVEQRDRNTLANELKTLLKTTELITFVQDIDNIFDPTPFNINFRSLLPFCEKANAKRRYRVLVNDILSDSFPTIEYFHAEEEIEDKDSNIKVLENIDLEIETLPKCSKHFFNFMKQLMFLSEKHSLYEHGKYTNYKGKYKLSAILLNMAYYVYVFDVFQFELSFETYWERIINLTFSIVRNVIIKANDGETESHCLTNLKDCFNDIISKLRTEYSDFIIFGDENDEPTQTSFLAFVRKESPNDLRDEFDDSDKFKRNKQLTSLLVIKAFRNFLREVVTGFSDEYISFEKVEKVFSINNQKIKAVTRKNNIKFFDKLNDEMFLSIAQIWLALEFYEQQNLENVIAEFIKNWIIYSISLKNEGVKEKEVFIYNQFQTPKLYEYPYNQWIKDSSGILHDIIINKYELFKKLLETSYANFNIYPLLECFCNCYRCEFTQVLRKKFTIRPLPNFGKYGYQSIYDGIQHSEKASAQKFDEFDPVNAPVFPIRNGWLIWETNGSFRISEDNYKTYMPVYTNLYFDPDFEKHHKTEFDRTIKYIREIFPIEEEREYILKCISSVLTGTIRKDTLIIQFGTGADGKSFFSNAVLAMLGEKAYKFNSGKSTEEVIKGVRVKINNVPNSESLGTTPKSSALLERQANSHDTDEGGKVQLIGKRYACFQEPDVRISGGMLNANTIKDILSGTAVSLRELYKSAKTVQLNPLLFLQTNSRLKIDDSTDGTKRRIKYIHMRSKFYTETTKATFKNLKFNFKANVDLEMSITSSIDFKSALFNILIPYCQDLLRSGIKSISDITLPESYLKDSSQFFSDATGGFGAFSEAFLENNPERFIPFNYLLEITSRVDSNGVSDEKFSDRFNQRCITEMNSQNYNRRIARDILVKTMSKFFAGKIYIIREDLNESETEELKKILYKESDRNHDVNDQMKFPEFKEKFCEPDARAEIEYYSKDKTSFSDVIIGEVYWHIERKIDDPDAGTYYNEAQIPI